MNTNIKGHVVATCECEICSIMRRLAKDATLVEIPDPDTKARELLEAVLAHGKQYFIVPFHAPELGIKPNEYYTVEVRRVELPDIPQGDNVGKLEEALPLPEYEVVT